MLIRRHQCREVHHVHHPHAQLRQVPAQQVHCGHRLQRRHVAGTRHDDIGFLAGIIAGPFPDADALGAVADRRRHIEPLRRRLLACDNHVHAVPTAQAVIRHPQQSVGVGRQIDPHELRLLVQHVVDEPGILMTEAIMLLPPDMGRQQIVQGCDWPAPGHRRGVLQPFGMLVEHRIDDVDERLVAIEQSVPAGQQIAFQPTLAGMLGEDFHHAAVGRQVVVAVDMPCEPGAVGDLEQRLQAIGRGFVGAEHPEIVQVAIALHHVAQELAHDMRCLAVHRAGRLHRSQQRAVKSGIRSGRTTPPLVCGLAPMRRVPSGARLVMSALGRPASSNNSSGR